MFLYGFAKSERENIDRRELENLRMLAGRYLAFTDDQIALALREAELREVTCNDPQQT